MIRFRLSCCIIGCVLTFLICGIGCKDNPASKTGDIANTPRETVSPRITESLKQNRPAGSLTEDILNPGDTLAAALDRHGVSPGEVHGLSTALRTVMHPGKIRAGTRFYMDLSTGSLTRFIIKKTRKEKVHARRDGAGEWQVEIKDVPVELALQAAAGEIDVSLWGACTDAGVPPRLILDTADLFGSQIDFASDIRKADSFVMFFNMEIYPDEEVFPAGIVATEFTNQGEKFLAVQFDLPDGTSDYFDINGDSLRRSFLKSPLRYRHISSGFSHRRYHPILKIYRPHLGIDYAAPSGTPVSALGDGLIIFCGRKGGYGKYIQVKHGDAYVTCYGHLSGYAKGMKKGVRVEQGQVIGYVGSTGLSTGPHLDFRVKYRGKFVNPLHVKSQPARPVPEASRDEFSRVRDYWIKKLNDIRQG